MEHRQGNFNIQVRYGIDEGLILGIPRIVGAGE
jgi:hypothetical protein